MEDTTEKERENKVYEDYGYLIGNGSQCNKPFYSLDNCIADYPESITDLEHRYLNKQKPLIDKNILVDVGVRLNSQGMLLYPITGLYGNEILQYQVIFDETDDKGKFKREFRGSLDGVAGYHLFGERDPSQYEVIIVCESLTKAAATYQAVKDEGPYYALVINGLNTGNMFKIIHQLADNKLFKDKIVVCCDNDGIKENELGINKQVYEAISDTGVKYVVPAKVGHGMDEWYATGDYAHDEMLEAIQQAEPLFTKRKDYKTEITSFAYQLGFDGYDIEVDYLIKGYLPAKSMGVLYGPSGQFKSFTAISWACHIATGKEWNGFKVDPAGVLYVVGEGGIGVPRRFKAWADKHNNTQEIPNLVRINQPVFMSAQEQVNLLANTIAEIKKNEGIEIKVVVLDTLARCFAGGDENRSADMGAFIAGCDFIKEATDATIVIVHHSGKDASKEARGSSALKAACDFEYKVQRPDPEQNELVLTNTKLKDGETNKKEAFALSTIIIGQDSDGDDLTSLALIDEGYEPPPEDEPDNDLNDNQLEVFNTIKKHTNDGEVFYLAVRDALKISGWDRKKINNLKRTLGQLTAKNKIEYNHDTGRIKDCTHSLRSH